MMSLLSTVAILVVIPALSVLYREFIDGRNPVASALLTASICASSFVLWLAITAALPGVSGSRLWLPTAALAALAGFLCSLPVRDATPHSLPALLFALVWTAVIFSPAALLVFFPSALGLPIALSAVDLGGALPVHVAVGSSAIVIALIARRRAVTERPRTGPATWTFVVWGVLLWIGWTFGLAGLELAIDDITSKIVLNAFLAPAAACAAWLIVQRVRLHSTTLDGAVTGLVCGLVAVTPACGYLEPIWAIVVGAIAGFACSSFVLSHLRSTARRTWFLVGVHLLAAAIGLVGLGLFGNGSGFIYTGGTAWTQTQFVGTLVIAVWALVASAVLWPVSRALIGRRKVTL